LTRFGQKVVSRSRRRERIFFLFFTVDIPEAKTIMPTIAQASCSSLWSERNHTYKSGGRCFNTSRAIRAFEIAGCSYDNINDVPRLGRQRAALTSKFKTEGNFSCHVREEDSWEVQRNGGGIQHDKLQPTCLG
jgi:hypothetical protein